MAGQIWLIRHIGRTWPVPVADSASVGIWWRMPPRPAGNRI